MPAPDGSTAYTIVNHWGSVAGIDLDTCEQVFRADFSSGDERVRATFAMDISPDGSELFVFQSPVLMPWRSIMKNVLFPIECLGLQPRDYQHRAHELLNMTGLERFQENYPSELSGGMQQRVAICRAFIHNPSLLLMDEPFSALDAMTRDTMNQELLRIWEEFQKTVLFVTHSIREAVFLSDRVFVMSQRPAVISKVIDVQLPRPRRLEIGETPEFNAYVSELRRAIEG